MISPGHHSDCIIAQSQSESSSFGSEWEIEAIITQCAQSQYIFALIFTQFCQASLHQSSSTNMTKAHNKCIIEFDPQYSTCRRDADLLWWQIIVASLKYRAEKMMYTWTYLNVFLSHVGCCYCICAAPPWCWTNLAQPFSGECICVHLPYHDLSKHFTRGGICPSRQSRRECKICCQRCKFLHFH